jgi:hypothetical protein
MFSELFGGQQLGKWIALRVEGALEDKAREDLCFKCLERRGLIGDLFEGVAYLRVVEGAGARDSRGGRQA